MKTMFSHRGLAFPFVRRCLELNTVFPERQPVEVVLLSRNDSDTGMRVFNSIEHYKLGIIRAAFTRGNSPFRYIPAYNVSLFLSANSSDVTEALGNGYPAGLVLPSAADDDAADTELRVAFDFDGVIADDSAEKIYQTEGIKAFYDSETAKAETAISPGPLGDLFRKLAVRIKSLNALIQFTRLVTSFSRAYADKKRVDAFFAIEPDIVDGEREEEPEVAAGEMLYELKGVSLSYGGESLALQDIDLSIPKGASVGVIGGTGSGKSAMISLLCRFIDPVAGTVYFRGHDIKESKLASVRSDMALVSQKPQLFKGTIRDNLTLGQSRTDEEIDAALRQALAYDFVYAKEAGLDSAVEENGTNFSGGQKQRLLIARAILSKRPLLILDDATSALDYRSDLQVRQNIRKLDGVTLLMVSQRATSIKDCDVIYVFDQGRIVGKGTHETLLRDCPIYQETYEAQVSQR